jgi:hypothetical protein
VQVSDREIATRVALSTGVSANGGPAGLNLGLNGSKSDRTTFKGIRSIQGVIDKERKTALETKIAENERLKFVDSIATTEGALSIWHETFQSCLKRELPELQQRLLAEKKCEVLAQARRRVALLELTAREKGYQQRPETAGEKDAEDKRLSSKVLRRPSISSLSDPVHGHDGSQGLQYGGGQGMDHVLETLRRDHLCARGELDVDSGLLKWLRIHPKSAYTDLEGFRPVGAGYTVLDMA